MFAPVTDAKLHVQNIPKLLIKNCTLIGTFVIVMEPIVKIQKFASSVKQHVLKPAQISISKKTVMLWTILLKLASVLLLIIFVSLMKFADLMDV